MAHLKAGQMRATEPADMARIQLAKWQACASQWPLQAIFDSGKIHVYCALDNCGGHVMSIPQAQVLVIANHLMPAVVAHLRNIHRELEATCNEA